MPASFFTAYVKAALFSSSDDNGEPMDKNYTPANIAPFTVGRMREDCHKFQRDNRMGLVGTDEAKAGYYFWMTRNGAGVGFWESIEYSDEVGRRLTKSAESFGSYDLYIGDDGQIHGA